MKKAEYNQWNATVNPLWWSLMITGEHLSVELTAALQLGWGMLSQGEPAKTQLLMNHDWLPDSVSESLIVGFEIFMACFLFQEKKWEDTARPRGYVVFVPLKECVLIASLSETIKMLWSIFGINKSAVYYPHTDPDPTFKE